MEKILVSSCLVGLPIRYNGSEKTTDVSIISKWRNEGRLVHICPEVSAGFPTPRPQAEIKEGFGADVLSGDADVFEKTKRKVTDLYISGAHIALRFAQKNGIRVALLTDGSPSCGSTFVYDGGFTGRTLSGNGVTTALLEQNGIKVFPDTKIADADAYLKTLENAPNSERSVSQQPTQDAGSAKKIMQTARVCFKVGSWSFIVLGLGHLVSHTAILISPQAKPPVVQAMQEFIVLMPGRKIDLLSLHHGFSLMMGILFVAFGGISLFFPKMDASFPFRSAPVIGLCLGVSAITLAVSVKFFFVVPVLFSLLSLISFGAAMALNKGPN